MSDDDQLQQLADRIRARLPATRGPGGHWTDATMALYAELTQAIEAEGYPRRLAALTVTGWIITGEPIKVCIERCIAGGSWKLPPPTRGRIGFTE